MVRRRTGSQHQKRRYIRADQWHQFIDCQLIQILWRFPGLRQPCVKEKTAAMALAGDAEAAIPISVNELKVAAVAEGSDIDHAPSAVFRYGTGIIILVKVALQVEEGQRADGNEHR